jgi:phytoene desaturase
MNVSIIGAGIGGLATAARLAAKGYAVTVFEANSYPGGKLSSIQLGNYRFDAGPSLFTLAHLVDEVIALNPNPELIPFSYQKLNTVCNYFYEDGLRLTAHADPNELANELATKTGVDKKTIFNYLQKAALKYESTAELFVEDTIHRIGHLKPNKVWKGLRNIPALDVFKTMHEVNSELLDEPHLVQFFNRYATYNGSNPYKAPGLLTMIPHLEQNLGAFFPEGGMQSITNALYQTCVNLGVTFHFSSKVEQIWIEDKQVKGIVLNGNKTASDLVVSDIDIHALYYQLMPGLKIPKRILKQEKSSSAIIFYWGMQSHFPELDLHNIFFSANYQEEFKHLFETKTMYDDPTVYVNISSKHKKDDAPINHENWFVMVNAPHNDGSQNWDEFISRTRKNVIQKLNRILNSNIDLLIAEESILEPRSIESKTSSYGGSLYGNSSNGKFSAFLRHKNYSSTYKGLYLCGGSVHPGGGIPLCLNSGKIVANLIEEDYPLT